MTAELLRKRVPFHLTADTGELRIDYKALKFGPKTTVADIDEEVATKTAPYPSTDCAYVIGPVRMPEGTWFYINLGFSGAALTVIGFGWGKLRDGFYESSISEFREQMQSYTSWLESSLGLSRPCTGRLIYQNELPWGSVQASYDAQTELPGIGIRFHQVTQ